MVTNHDLETSLASVTLRNCAPTRPPVSVDDIVDGVVGVLDNPPPTGGHEVYNIGDSSPVGLMEMISTLERALGREAVKIMRPMQPGDVTATYADVSKLNALIGYKPQVSIQEGLPRFVAWWRDHKDFGGA